MFILFHSNYSIIYEDIDDCLSSPCDHGTCSDAFNDYICTCDPGWDGKECRHSKAFIMFLVALIHIFVITIRQYQIKGPN